MVAGESGRRAAFLDRDGVINRAIMRDGQALALESADALEYEDGALEWLPRLRELGFRLVVVTNQPEVGRGTLRKEAVEEIHRIIGQALPIEVFYVCYHGGTEGCECRKPRPGMILQAARELGIAIEESYLIGDRWRDVDAGYNAGIRTIWIDRGYQERQPDHPATVRVPSVEAAVRWIEERESAGTASPAVMS